MSDIKQEIYEKFTSPGNKKKHYQKHKKEFDAVGIHLSQKEYEMLADSIANSPVSSEVVGYMKASDNASAFSDDVYVKYDKVAGVAVVYVRQKKGAQPLIISCYPIDKAKFERRMEKVKLDDIPKGL